MVRRRSNSRDSIDFPIIFYARKLSLSRIDSSRDYPSILVERAPIPETAVSLTVLITSFLISILSYFVGGNLIPSILCLSFGVVLTVVTPFGLRFIEEKSKVSGQWCEVFKTPDGVGVHFKGRTHQQEGQMFVKLIRKKVIVPPNCNCERGPLYSTWIDVGCIKDSADETVLVEFTSPFKEGRQALFTMLCEMQKEPSGLGQG